jgi:hypothetical protein
MDNLFGIAIVWAAPYIAIIQPLRLVVEARWVASHGRERRRLETSLDSLDDRERALGDEIGATPPRSLRDATIQLALGLSEVEALHGGDGRNQPVHLLATAFGYLARDLGLDPEVYGLGEYSGPHLTAAVRMT